MNTRELIALAFAASLLAATPLPAMAGGKTVVVEPSALKWKDMGAPGLVAAPVSGDMEKGPSRFFLQYPAGFVTPLHHHSADHYVTLISGNVTLTVDGKAYKLVPGSYFALTGKQPHAAKVDGITPAVFFIQADGPWDVVMQK